MTKKYQPIIPLLEQLCYFEETVVREAACQSLIDISDKLSEDDVIAVIVPCMLRLAEGASFTHKISALHIMSAVYEKTGEHKTTLRK